MPSYSGVGYVYDQLTPDADGWPVGHYRGRGGDQSATGPRGPYLSDTARPYAGRGPKGWKRSDAIIREDVCEMLADHGDVDPSDVEVEVSDGDVILRGTVRSRWAKWYVEDLALAVHGVRDVVNELRIARGPSGEERGGPTSESP